MRKIIGLAAFFCCLTGFSSGFTHYDRESVQLVNALTDCMTEFMTATKDGAKVMDATHQHDRPGESFTVKFGMMDEEMTVSETSTLVIRRTRIMGSGEMQTTCTLMMMN